MCDENWVDINAQKVFYRKKGLGIAVVLIHGFAEDGNIWNNQIDFLQKHAQLIIPDLPGSGRSVYRGLNSLLMEDYAGIIKHILDQEKVSSCIMIGHSMGGYIALAFAEKYPEMLDAFSLFHSTAYADSEDKKTIRKKSIDFIIRYGSAEFIRQSTPSLFSETTKSQHPEMIQNLIAAYDNFRPEVLVSYYEAMMQRPDRTDALRNYKKPVQFIIGDQDNAVPLEQSLRLCHIPEISYIHLLKSTGHMGMLEAVEKANYLLLDFINYIAA